MMPQPYCMKRSHQRSGFEDTTIMIVSLCRREKKQQNWLDGIFVKTNWNFEFETLHTIPESLHSKTQIQVRAKLLNQNFFKNGSIIEFSILFENFRGETGCTVPNESCK